MTELFDDEFSAEGMSDTSPTERIRRIRQRDADRTRTHHVVRRDPSQVASRDAEGSSLWGEDAWARHARRPRQPLEDPELDVWIESFEETPPRRRAGAGVDPVVLRLGAIVGAAVLITPVILTVRDDSAELRSTPSAASASTVAVAPAPAPAPTVPATLSTDLTRTAARGLRSAKQASGGAAIAEPARASTAPSCAMEYDIVFGDYWIRIADAAGVELGELLAANNAFQSTPLFAGDEICLPPGATTPAPPPSTSAPPATEPPPTSQPPASDPPATDPPSTPAPTDPPTTPTPTRPPTTPAPTDPPSTPAPTAPPSRGTPEQTIRDVWPDDIEERALTIAQRESSLDPRAYNGSCCYGLFQIHFEGNRRFLAERGITSAEQLYDAGTNTRAAYALYQISGWSPWASTDPGP